MTNPRTSFITGARHERRNAASCERCHGTGDSAERRAEHRSGDPAERDVLAGIVLEGLGFFGGRRGR